MADNNTNFLSEVSDYYTNKLIEHGETPRGVDWNGEESQELRFDQLCKIVKETSNSFTINDLGCGYSALLGYMNQKFSIASYLGIDVSEKMVHSAQNHYQTHPNTRFIVATEPDSVADYGIASGVFNVRLEKNELEWLEYIKVSLDILDRTSKKGFAFNCLTSYSDEDKKREYLYYADPCKLFDLCKRRYSSQVTLLHDYGLYEFTILVRKI